MNTEFSDERLVQAVLEGDRSALDVLIERYQDWIYNLLIRVLWDSDDAADCTQEVLVKLVTHLSSFKGESKFRTWLYRVAANHALSWKRKSKAEQSISSFSCYGDCLRNTPDQEIPDDKALLPERALLYEEVKVGCMTGMLLCLNRTQRLVFVLGELFQIDDRTGAEIMNITRDNFRQKLSRSRKDLATFLKGNCGLVNPKNPCRCVRKTKGFIDMGIVNPENMQFTRDVTQSIEDVVGAVSKKFESLVEQSCTSLYRSHPFLKSSGFTNKVSQIIADHEFKTVLDLK